MYAHLEENGTSRSDCTIHDLSWMGKVPESMPEDDSSWKLNRVNYYQEGWLACGNAKGTVGVTFTACHCRKTFESPPRSNFNLRGHRSEVSLVKWNEPYQKLATCDVMGVIFVWIKHEGRWSIELINDRNSQVTDFTWSHDGRMALICYRDGFVLVGSVAGQRYWSSMLNLDGCVINCGIWTPDDQKVMFGTTDGQLLVMSSTGAMLTQVAMLDGIEISTMAWSCEKFSLSEQDADTATDQDKTDRESDKKDFTLTICFKTGVIYFMSNYDDVCPKVVHTGLTGVKTEWSNDGQVLAVCGFVRLPNLKCRNELRFYSRTAQLRCTLDIPQQGKPITALTWGHNDKRLFIAIGCCIHMVWVSKKVASLQFLCRRCVQQRLRDEPSVQKLPLPSKIRANISAMFSPTIKGYIPDPHRLREFVCITPPTNERLHCTMIRHGDESSGGHYTLYLEYLGGLIPLLKGKRASKIRPEFVIYDPKIRNSGAKDEEDCCVSGDSSVSDSDEDDDKVSEGCGSPRMQRKRRLKKLRERMERRDSAASQRPIEELMFDDNLPETNKLLEVTSNIWGTKFKIHALSPFLPEDLGHILYKTSLLHLQPRQMTISIVELAELRPHARDPNYCSTQFSESEDEGPGLSGASDTSPMHISPQGEDASVRIVPEAATQPQQQRGSLLGSSTKCEPSNLSNLPNGMVEVPSSERTTSSCMCPFSARPEKLSHIEIRSLDSSPPQRRSPSFKTRSLSPAEQVVYTSNTLVDGHIDGDGFTFVEDINKVKRNQAGYCAMNPRPIEVCDPRSFDSDSLQNTLNVMQLAAKKLENAIQLQPARETSSVISVGSDSGDKSRGQMPRWAGKAYQDLKYIDDDPDENGCMEVYRQDQRDAVYCSMNKLSAKEIMTSVQTDSCPTRSDVATEEGAETMAAKNVTYLTRTPPLDLPDKRVFLAKPLTSRSNPKMKDAVASKDGYNSSFCSIDEVDTPSQSDCSPQNSAPSSPLHRPCPPQRRGSLELRRSLSSDRTAMSRADCEVTQSASVPTSPVHKLVSRHKKAKSKQDLSTSTPVLKSPLNRRRGKTKNYNKAIDSSDEEATEKGTEDVTTCANYKNLETFQKAQLTKKLRKVRTRSEGEKYHSPPRSPRLSPVLPRQRHLVMHNKAPMWNENSQVYQLDFGGRVTQESAKNFQIEFRGKQVMQFGRIDSNAYTMDFQYPFTALQAFAVALANVTQRLK